MLNDTVQMLVERNTSISTLSGFKDALVGFTIFPDLLKSRSDAALVAGTAKNFFATFDSIGNVISCSFHRSKGSRSASSLTS